VYRGRTLSCGDTELIESGWWDGAGVRRSYFAAGDQQRPRCWVYRDEQGGTPILKCVIEAEKILLATQTTKTYLGPPGVAGFNEATRELLLGKDNEVLA
jgi:hypothetical protein